jgi:hypothetical protein
MGMDELREPLIDKRQTSDAIKKIIGSYNDDLKNIFVGDVPLSDFGLRDFYNFVKNIPFRKDPRPIEIIARPYLIVKHKDLGMDCKKKSVLVGSYCEYNNIPYRLVISSKRGDKKCHHIFVQIEGPDGSWKNVDATYPEYNIFEPKSVTYAEVV